MRTFRVVILSILPPQDVARLLRRLRNEVPEVFVAGVLYETRPANTGLQRLRRLVRLQRQQPGYTAYVLRRLRAIIRNQAISLSSRLIRLAHACPSNPNATRDLSIDDLRVLLERDGGVLHVTTDLHKPETLQCLRDLTCDLGLVYGTRILKPELFAIPRQGSINIHKRKTPDYRGGGPVGLWELLDRQTEIGITVHQVAVDVDAGDVVRSTTMPIEPYDTLVSLALKADVVGNDLLVDAVADYARGTVTAVKQVGPGRVFKAPKPHALHALEQQIARARPPARPERGRALTRLIARVVLYGPRVIAANWRRRLRGEFPVVILYHHLISDRPHRMASSTDAFYRQMQYLMRTYRVVSLGEAVRMVRSGKVTAPTVAVTFDDGYRDNFVNLRAVTEALGLDAALFICPGHINSGEPFGHDTRNRVLGFPPLTWEQVGRMQACGLEFHSHTISHYDCGLTDEARLHTEIASSRTELERRLGRKVESFSFPWGSGKNMSAPAVALAQANYANVFSGCHGLNLPANQQRWHFYRSSYAHDTFELELQIQQVLELDPEGPKLPF